jgi:hypothetical protein
MGRIPLEIVPPILLALKLDDEAMGDAVLGAAPASAWRCRAATGRNRAWLTCRPSGLLSRPPTEERTYGVFVAGWRHWVFSASMRSQTWWCG